MFTPGRIGVKFRVVDLPNCEEAMCLLDSYAAALTAFHGSQEPFLDGLRPRDPEWPLARRAKDQAYARLVFSRREYWQHVESHGCRETAGFTTHAIVDGPYAGTLRIFVRF